MFTFALGLLFWCISRFTTSWNPNQFWVRGAKSCTHFNILLPRFPFWWECSDILRLFWDLGSYANKIVDKFNLFTFHFNPRGRYSHILWLARKWLKWLWKKYIRVYIIRFTKNKFFNLSYSRTPHVRPRHIRFIEITDLVKQSFCPSEIIFS